MAVITKLVTVLLRWPEGGFHCKQECGNFKQDGQFETSDTRPLSTYLF